MRLPLSPDSYNAYVARARRTNGATQTFRRPSHATSLSGTNTLASSREASVPRNATNPGPYVPPHAQPGRSSVYSEGHYSRDQLMQVYRAQSEADELRDGLPELYMGGWDPNSTNGASGASWGRKEEHSRETQSGVDQFWDRDARVQPVHPNDMTDEDKQVCLHSRVSWYSLTFLVVPLRQLTFETACSE